MEQSIDFLYSSIVERKINYRTLFYIIISLIFLYEPLYSDLILINIITIELIYNISKYIIPILDFCLIIRGKK